MRSVSSFRSSSMTRGLLWRRDGSPSLVASECPPADVGSASRLGYVTSESIYADGLISRPHSHSRLSSRSIRVPEYRRLSVKSLFFTLRRLPTLRGIEKAVSNTRYVHGASFLKLSSPLYRDEHHLSRQSNWETPEPPEQFFRPEQRHAALSKAPME